MLLQFFLFTFFTSATDKGIQLHLMQNQSPVISWRCANASPIRRVLGGNELRLRYPRFSLLLSGFWEATCERWQAAFVENVKVKGSGVRPGSGMSQR